MEVTFRGVNKDFADECVMQFDSVVHSILGLLAELLTMAT